MVWRRSSVIYMQWVELSVCYLLFRLFFLSSHIYPVRCLWQKWINWLESLLTAAGETDFECWWIHSHGLGFLKWQNPWKPRFSVRSCGVSFRLFSRFLNWLLLVLVQIQNLCLFHSEHQCFLQLILTFDSSCLFKLNCCIAWSPRRFSGCFQSGKYSLIYLCSLRYSAIQSTPDHICGFKMNFLGFSLCLEETNATNGQSRQCNGLRTAWSLDDEINWYRDNPDLFLLLSTNYEIVTFLIQMPLKFSSLMNIS